MLATLLALWLAIPDFDRDGDIDQSDYGLLQVHLGEPAMPVNVFDLNGDGWIDTNDVEVFEEYERKAMK
jgi:hypothetical protein